MAEICRMRMSSMTIQIPHFDLAATLSCGQLFRYEPHKNGFYVMSGARKVYISQNERGVTFHGVPNAEVESFWAHYFDLSRDYTEILNTLKSIDPIIKAAAEFSPGIRILNQDPWETLIGFIISANNSIPHIMRCMNNLFETFGESVAFPSAEILATLSEDDLKCCKTGFRGKYIIDAAKKVASGELDFPSCADLSTDELRKQLMSVKGVGVKVADCVMMFSHGRREVFPVDVWINRAVSNFYFGGEERGGAEIQAFAREKFGKYAGYANQALFHYARSMKI